MKKLRVLALSIIFMAALSACAGHSMIAPKPSPVGRSVYDFKHNTFSYVTPNYGGGYDAYNSSTNQFSHIRPDASGGYTSFNYRTGQFSHINPAY